MKKEKLSDIGKLKANAIEEGNFVNFRFFRLAEEKIIKKLKEQGVVFVNTKSGPPLKLTFAECK